MYKIISLLTVALLTNCQSLSDSECVDDSPRVSEYVGDKIFPLIISNEWSATQQTEVIKAISFWEAVFEDSDIELRVITGDCDLEDGCIRPVEYEPILKEFDDPEDTGMVVGLHLDGVISVLFDFEDIELITVHELGHHFGLHHEDAGIMNPGTGGMTYSLGPVGIKTLKSHGFL